MRFATILPLIGAASAAASSIELTTGTTACALNLDEGSTEVTTSAGCTLASDNINSMASTINSMAALVAAQATTISTLTSKITSLESAVQNKIVPDSLPTTTVHWSGNCNVCKAYDFYIGQGNRFAEVEAWGGHQGGGIHGAYVHGKWTINGYTSMSPVVPVVHNSWGTCGSWEVVKVTHATAANPCVVLPANAACSTSNRGACINGWLKCSNEDGDLSMHGFHSNVLRVKFNTDPNNPTYGGPYHIKLTTNQVVGKLNAGVDQNSKIEYVDVSALVC